VSHHGQSQLRFSFDQSYGQRTYRRRKIPCKFSWRMTIAQAGSDQIATIVSEKAEVTGVYGSAEVSLFSFDIDRSTAKPKLKLNLCMKGSALDSSLRTSVIWPYDQTIKNPVPKCLVPCDESEEREGGYLCSYALP